jgi:amino acid adenylation domain-containing protein
VRDESKGREQSADGNTYPLTPMQLGMLFHRLRYPGSGVDVEQVVIRLREPLDALRMKRAFDGVCTRHDALRAYYSWQGRDEPAQHIQRRVMVPLTRLDWSEQPGHEAALRELLRRDRATDFDMRNAPLMRLTAVRLGGDEHVLIWSFHHILLDGRSFPLVLAEVFESYDKASGSVRPPTRSFVEFLNDRAATHAQASRDYFRELLAGFSGPVPLDVAFVSRERPSEERNCTLRLSRAESDELRATAERAGVKLSVLFNAAWALLLQRYGGQDDVVFGTTRACRERAAADMVGLRINTLPMRVRLGADDTVAQLLDGLSAQQHALREHERFALSEITPLVTLPAGVPLFETLVVFDHATLAHTLAQRSARFADMQVDYHGQTNFPLTLAGYGDPELLVRLEFEPARFDQRSARRMLQHFCGLLSALARAASAPSTRLRDVPMLTQEERRQLVERWNATDLPFPGEARMHDAFEARAKETPGALALVCRGASLRYGELDARANQLAHRLMAHGVGRGDMVALCIPRSHELVVSMLAVLKAGAAYVPLDPAYPLDRLAFMLDDTQAKLVLTVNALREQLPPCHALCLEDAQLEALPTSAPICASTSDDVAYVIYTSGSTGRPKGVVVRHRPALNLINWVNETFEVGASDRLLFVTSVCFDLSVYDVFGSLSAGASIQIATAEELRDPRALVRLLSSGEITFWDSAPATLAQLLPFLPQAEANSRLRLVFMSGDWIPVPLPDALRAAYPGAELVSLGGATEATIWSNYYRIGAVDPRWPSIPYGRPIQNARYYVLDARLEPQPIGVPGELFIGGYCLADGYHNRPDLNAEKFIDSPFLPGTKLYRTGDLARFMPSGDLEFLGRLDFQVKVRGFRIELGEIEAVLNQHAGIATSLVDAPRSNGVDRTLVAYMVPRAELPDANELKALCQKRLPEYMVPAHFMFLEQLPVTSNGKVDRRALPAPSCAAKAAYEAPRDDLEASVAASFAHCLGVERVGIHDDFFELGGQSLAAVRVIGALSSTLSMELSVGLLFERPTVARFSEAVRAGVGKVDALLVPLSRGTNLVPVFFICGIHLYQDLANAIGSEHASYGIFLPAEERAFERARQHSVDQVQLLSKMYVEAIKRQFPKGPYVLAGVSFGGVLAYEMARQLSAQHDDIPLLVLIDPILPSALRLSARKWLRERARRLRDGSLRDYAGRLRERVEALLRPAVAREAASEPDLEGMRRESYERALAQYDSAHNSYAGRTLLIRAQQFAFADHDVDSMLGWAKRLSGDVLVSEAPGTHIGVLREARTAELLRRGLDWVSAYVTPASSDSLLPQALPANQQLLTVEAANDQLSSKVG